MPTVGIDTNEGHDMKKDTETRIREIQAEVAAIDEFAEGSIASSRKPYRLKDGTVRLASPQYRFKSKGARGKQVSKYIPPSAVARVKKLIEKIEELKAAVGVKKTIAEYGVDEKYFLDTLDEMVEQAFDDQCTGANPRYPLMSEIKEMYLKAYYG